MIKPINQRAKKILEYLLSKMENGYAKIDKAKGSFLPVIVEKVGNNLFSVAHYYEQNGDLIPDPEMIFWKSGTGDFFPTYFKNFFGEQERIVFENGNISAFRPRLQNEHAVFAGKWLSNIKNQQNL